MRTAVALIGLATLLISCVRIHDDGSTPIPTPTPTVVTVAAEAPTSGEGVVLPSEVHTYPNTNTGTRNVTDTNADSRRICGIRSSSQYRAP